MSQGVRFCLWAGIVIAGVGIIALVKRILYNPLLLTYALTWQSLIINGAVLVGLLILMVRKG